LRVRASNILKNATMEEMIVHLADVKSSLDLEVLSNVER
jgi:hypothetical protein